MKIKIKHLDEKGLASERLNRRPLMYIEKKQKKEDDFSLRLLIK
jgi:hypothetical protein